MPVRLEGCPDYLIFFDNVRVDGLVKTWSAGPALNQISQANISMLYFDELYQTVGQRTNVRIFVRNMFTLQYDMVFDGEIQGRTRSRRGGEIELSFIAEDYQSWLNQTPNPLFFSLGDNFNKPLQYMWGAQGIDYTKIKGIMSEWEREERGSSIVELWNKIHKVLDDAYALAQDKNSVFAWARLKQRLSVMGDINGAIDQHILKSMRLMWTGSVLKSVYSSMTTATGRFLLEMYQDRDGLIRIKPGFWAADIPRVHIIDPSLEIETTENTSWKRRISRTLVVGGVQTVYEQSKQGNELLTPVGFYTASAGYVSSSPLPRVKADETIGTQSPLSGFKMWLDFDLVTSEFGPRPDKPVATVSDFHHGTDFGYPVGTEVRSLFSGNVKSSGYDSTRGKYVVVALDAPLDDIELHFFHFSEFGDLFRADPDSPSPWHVSTESILGYVGSTGASTGNHLHVGVLQRSTGEFINLRGWLADYSVAKVRASQFERFKEELRAQGYTPQRIREAQALWEQSGQPAVSVTGMKLTDIDNDTELPRLLEITNDERKYGISLSQVQHELLRPDSGAVKVTGMPVQQLLRQFAQLSYQYSNAEVTATTINLIAAPWIRPGFNVWCNPALGRRSRVYYVQSVTHSGSMDAGVFTTLGVSGGLDLSEYQEVRDKYAAQRQSDNFFLTSLYAGPAAFGDVVTDFDAEIERAIRFQRFFGRGADNVQAHQSQYLRGLYRNRVPPQASSVEGQMITNQWSGDLSYAEVTAQIAAEYATAPQVVQERMQAIAAAVKSARDKALLYYAAGKAVSRL